MEALKLFVDAIAVGAGLGGGIAAMILIIMGTINFMEWWVSK